MGRLEGKVALISGGARGQGRSHAIAMASEGADIIVFDVCRQLPTVEIPMATPEDLAETVALVAATGRRVVAEQADVRDTEALARVVDAGMSEFGRIDIVVANAGIDTIASTASMPDDVWEEMIGVNLTGVFKTIRAALPTMIEQNTGGAIIITSSCAGLRPYPNHIHYCTSKYGVIGIAQCMALELAHYRIRCNVVAPAAVRTDLVINPVLFRLFAGNSDATEEDVTPMFQSLNLIDEPWVDPKDISNAVVWLASDEARWVTGITLPIDLGFLIKGPFSAEGAATRVGENREGLAVA
jgi:(+)-trans-carveol dehydrogenase